MEKTIFLFRRKEGTSRAEFGEHYIQVHAPLGAHLTRCLLGYTVNLVEGEDGPDAITEHWVPAAMDLLTPSIAYASMEDFEKVFTDDRSFIGDFELYVVTDETDVVAADPLDSPLRQETGEAKAVWFYRHADDVPPPPPGARRVIDNHVGRKLAYRDDEGWEVLAPDCAVIRFAWGPDLDKSEASLSGATMVTEFRFIAAPEW